MRFLYNFLLNLFSYLLPLARFFGEKAKMFLKGQRSIAKKSEEICRWRQAHPEEILIWFHCASLGEFEQGRPVIEAYKKYHPDHKVLITFFSPSGYEVRKDYKSADFISYLPIDTLKKSRNFVQNIQPDIVVLVKYEFWPNLIREIKNTKALLTGISVILREDQVFFKPWGKFFRNTLKNFDFLFVQNIKTGRLLDSIGFSNYEVIGDTRFDRVIATAKAAEEIPGIKEWIAKKKVMVAGSVWKEDMDVLIPFIKKHSDIQFIIAPHEINSDQIQDWASELNASLYSSGNFTGQALIIDSIGLLSKIYKYADYAFVGGGFKTGLHNILEPAVFGIPVFFGNKKYEKFQEAVDLINLGVAFPVEKDLDKVIENLDSESIKFSAETYVNSNLGATEKILNYLNQS